MLTKQNIKIDSNSYPGVSITLVGGSVLVSEDGKVLVSVVVSAVVSVVVSVVDDEGGRLSLIMVINNVSDGNEKPTLSSSLNSKRILVLL